MAEEPKTEQEVVEIFQRLMEQRDSLSTAAIERRSDIAEHDLVIKTLEKVDDDRRCHRLIGDVMVERSKKTVLPEVVENRNNLAAVRGRCDGDFGIGLGVRVPSRVPSGASPS